MTTSPPPSMQHVTESHQIFDRVTLLEANMSSLADSVNKLASSVQSTEATVGEIKALISSVGKTDGKTILTLGASVVGALAIIGTVLIGPVQRDLMYLDKSLAKDAQGIELAIARSDAAASRAAGLDGELKLVEWRLKALEEKR